MLKIYNSLTRKKETFKPIKAGEVSLYVCGPTVYDFCHIGNARTYTAFDMVIRFLQFLNYNVNHVRNITDIDDKIIKRAIENNSSFQEVVATYTQAMQDDFAQLGLLTPNAQPRATEYIPQIVSFIETLLARNAAYVASNGDVYYNIRQFKDYGKLSHRDIEKLQSGVRVEVNEVKNDPLDFVLWKIAKPQEPKWPSPWGDGRPGWHIECSAMSVGELGKTFDIHGGGKDLIFPHHENEIAQSEAANGCHFVNYWMHAGYLQLDSEKMSKSLGNFFTLRDLLQAHPPEILRYFLLSSHYRSPLQFSATALQQAKSSLDRFYVALRHLPEVPPATDHAYEKKFVSAMNDDFNTPIAFSVLFELAHDIQRARENNLPEAARLGALLKKLGGVLNILQDNPNQFLQTGKNLDTAHIEALIIARNEARTRKDWKEGDRIRQELIDLSIILEDGPQGTTWKYVEKN